MTNFPLINVHPYLYLYRQLPDIRAVRASFKKFQRATCPSTETNSSYIRQVEDSEWLQQVCWINKLEKNNRGERGENRSDIPWFSMKLRPVRFSTRVWTRLWTIPAFLVRNRGALGFDPGDVNLVKHIPCNLLWDFKPNLLVIYRTRT